jgi:nucleotide-binding universal stress UspA family protein
MQTLPPIRTESVRLKRILYATDFSAASVAALPYAAAMARHYGATIYTAHVIPAEAYASVSLHMRDAALLEIRKFADQRMAALLNSSHFQGLRYQILVDHGEIWPVLSRMAKENAIELLAIGTCGRRGVEKLLLGSVAEEILRLADYPTLLVGPETSVDPQAEVHLRNILCATDFQPQSQRAMNYAFSLAKDYAANLSFLHVAEDVWKEPLSTRMQAADFFRLQMMERGWPEHEEDVRSQYLVEFGAPAERILEVAKRLESDLIVLGVRGSKHPHMAAHLPGPVAYDVVSGASCPILAVRGEVGKGRQSRSF